MYEIKIKMHKLPDNISYFGLIIVRTKKFYNACVDLYVNQKTLYESNSNKFFKFIDLIYENVR